MHDLNRVQRIGHLGHVPEVKYTATGTARATPSVATCARWKDAADPVRHDVGDRTSDRGLAPELPCAVHGVVQQEVVGGLPILGTPCLDLEEWRRHPVALAPWHPIHRLGCHDVGLRQPPASELRPQRVLVLANEADFEIGVRLRHAVDKEVDRPAPGDKPGMGNVAISWAAA